MIPPRIPTNAVEPRPGRHPSMRVGQRSQLLSWGRPEAMALKFSGTLMLDPMRFTKPSRGVRC